VADNGARDRADETRAYAEAQARQHPALSSRLSRDAHIVFSAQGLRAFAYGVGSIALGVGLADAGLSAAEAGVVLGAVLVGSAGSSIAVGRYADRLGRRRTYAALFLVMAVAGAVFGLTDWLPALVLAALTGTVSADVVESGPFTSLEQPMLADAPSARATARTFAVYNAIATISGSLGALLVAGVALLPDAPSSQRLFLVYTVAAAGGLLLATRLTPAVEAPPAEPTAPRAPLGASRRNVYKLSALFALDSFGGGFVVQAFVAYVFTRRYDASPEALGATFFAVGILQAASFQVAARMAGRFGLLRTMVFTHLPSNLLLAAIALAPNLETAVMLLLARFALSQMDVPARQAYVMALVAPEERTAAAGYTNAARYVSRPVAPLVAGVVAGVSLAAPFVLAGVIKSVYDLALYLMFRRVPLRGA
jgi:MFS family permease